MEDTSAAQWFCVCRAVDQLHSHCTRARSAFAYIGASANGTNDPTASYNLFEANTVFSGQFPIMSYRPFQNVLLVNTITSLGSTDAFSAGGNVTFPPLAAPSNLGSFATTGGQLPDSTTYFYHVVATDNASNPSAHHPKFQ